MNRKVFYIAIVVFLLYTFAIGYILQKNFFYLKLEILIGESIGAQITSILILSLIGIIHLIAIYQFVISKGKMKRLLKISGGTGTLFVIIYSAYRLIESFFIGSLYFHYFYGLFGLCLFAIGTFLFSNKTY